MSGSKQQPDREEKGKTVAVVGAGGNIGSHLVPLLGRIPEITTVSLIDGDRYEEKNRWSQDILPRDVGKPKARVQAQRLERTNPALDVRAVCARVELVPLGLLRTDVVLAGPDSRIARQYVNQACWWLNTPLIDGAVEASELLARVSVYVPGPRSPCLECSWTDEDYAALEQTYPCGGDSGPAPTNAPASLGAVTAGLMAIECQKLLRGDHDRLLCNREVMLSAGHPGHCVTRFGRNPSCRFSHDTWSIEPLLRSPARLSELTLGELLRRLSGSGDHDRWQLALRLEGHGFARLGCPSCRTGFTRGLLHLAGRVPRSRRRCRKCGHEMITRGFDTSEDLDVSVLGQRERRRTLRSLGFRPGDILTVRYGDGTQRHVELLDPYREAPR